ncbi:MAG: TIGR02147 family protein, partial [Bdellovibrionota bacterium]
MQGKRNLSPSAAMNVAKALGLSAEQKNYFLALVDVACAKDETASVKAEKLRLQARSRLVMKQVPATQAAILAKPQHLLVRELCTLKDFRFDPKWVARKMKGVLNEEAAAESLGLLVAGGYLRQDKSGAWKQSEPALDTGHSFDELSVLRHHVETLRIWQGLLPAIPKERRELGVLNIPIDAAKIPEFKRRIHVFQDEIIGWLESEQNANTLVQLGTYLIPMTGDSC